MPSHEESASVLATAIDRALREAQLPAGGALESSAVVVGPNDESAVEAGDAGGSDGD
jgi:hypothetical protein